MSTKKAQQFEVYIDESGLFYETSLSPSDRIEAHKSRQDFPSQLAGIVFSKGGFDEQKAEAILRHCCKQTGIEFSHQFHSTETVKTKTSEFVQAICPQLDNSKLQPFRIVNEEQVSFGDREQNYFNILAELLVRICFQLAKSFEGPIELHVVSAKVVKEKKDDGEIVFFDREDYLNTITENFARASVRKGYSRRSKDWTIGSFRLGSGKANKILQICDFVSNASHADFKKCDLPAKAALNERFGEFNWTLSSDAFFEEVNDFISFDSYGLAMMNIVRRAVDVEKDKTSVEFKTTVNKVCSGFAELPASVQTPQIEVLVNWLTQNIESRKDLQFSNSAATWIIEILVPGLEDAKSDPSLCERLRFCATSLSITAQNHLGMTIEAMEQTKQIEQMLPKIAKRWEYLPDVFEAMIAQAVHQNDRFDYQVAIDGLDSIIGFYSNLSGFFNDAFPDLFPKEMKSDLWARALGTKVQSETFLLLQGKCDLETVRNTSDAAIEQFEMQGDRDRQFQYRSEIEAITSNWNTAREFLAKSIGIDGQTHESIAGYISTLDTRQQAFPLLHWTRIGGLAAAENDREEFAEFYAAFSKHRFQNNPWILGTASSQFPIHSILRRISVIKAFNGDKASAGEAVNRLRNIISESKSFNPVFEAILIATLVQVSAMIYKNGASEKFEYLDNSNPKKPGAIQLIKRLIQRVGEDHTQMAELFTPWLKAIEPVVAGKADPQTLLPIGRQIGY